MPTVQGKVENIESQMRPTKYGQKPVFKVVIEGNKYNSGFTKPKFSIGDEVTFQYTDGSYGPDIDQPTVRVVSGGATDAPVPVKTYSKTPAGAIGSTGGYKEKTFPVPPLHGDRAIIRQNALTNAREAIVAGYVAEGKPLPTRAKLKEEIIALAREFEAFTAGDIDLENAKKELAEEATPKKAKKATVEDLMSDD